MSILRSLSRRLGALLALALLALLVRPAHADTPIALYAAYDGRMNFTGTQVSWRAYANSTRDATAACVVYTPTSTLTANLTIPLGATIVAAHLYWAGSGTGDYNVTLQGTAVSATRRHTSTTVGGGLNYYGAAADVTSIVKAKGSGTYSFSGLSVSNGDPWCGSQAVLGGFSLLVVYSHPLEPERVLNLYEGFRYVQNSTVNVSASNFRWASPAIAVKEKARVGHITWEGDTTLSGGGERLLFEGTELTDSMNPAGNQFNSRSNINGDNNSYGVDFDAYDTTVTIWAGYDAVVDTSYQTGQDLVLLGAEVLLVPTLPVSDMTVALTGPTELQVTVPANYKIVLSNNGPYTAPGPLTATTVLPVGVSYTSASGTNWSCSAGAQTSTGQTVICTYTGAVAPGSSSSELTLTTAVTSTGEKTTKVTVGGADDDKPANNSATHTIVAKAAPPPPSTPAAAYVFTKGVCPIGSAIGAATDSGPCSIYAGPRIAGETPLTSQPIYVTAVDTANRAVAQSKTVATPVTMKFSLSCIEPVANAGVRASYAGTLLPRCTSNGQMPATGSATDWSSDVQVNFPMNVASVPFSFTYDDVGSVQLNLLQGTKTASASFVSRPWKLGFRSIRRESDGVEDPVDHAPTDPGFAMAGEPLSVEIGVLLYGKTEKDANPWAPNFGNEKRNADTTCKLAPTLASVQQNKLDTATTFQPSAGEVRESDITQCGGGSAVMSQAWTEVGITNFIAKLDNYLGVGDIGPTAERTVGRFYPAYYTTNLFGPFACPLDDGNTSTEKKCLFDWNSEAPMPAVYAGQDFRGEVYAQNVDGDPVKNFVGDWYKPVTLTAVAASGGAVLPKNFASATSFAPLKMTDPNTKLVSYGEIAGTLTYALDKPYTAGDARTTIWTAPSLVFLRANSDEVRLTGTGTSARVQIKSMRAPEAVSEGGINVLNGRTRVANALGTDILPTPLAVQVEYWDGSTWRAHPGFVDPTGSAMNSNTASFIDCTYGLASAASRPNNCLDVLAGDGKPVDLTQGKGTLWLKRTGKLTSGRSRDGQVSVQFKLRSWLPSTNGRVTFGRYRSPVIYMREVY
ncbi:hypothetical protein G4G28_11030 [Massilia sp. Dwa41.01b]|uniref:DUF11 domain-containing protein n=1 Tax=unclassified Massilia TaxID=2609279 RepID=UPI00160097EA|nr:MULTISPECIES: DUF11 domain-containing protein [unclassified Massilia]QNA88886.1 hypothetical protein G4G28_11030 [Massilia sp. Dwa41.01b]